MMGKRVSFRTVLKILLLVMTGLFILAGCSSGAPSLPETLTPSAAVTLLPEPSATSAPVNTKISPTEIPTIDNAPTEPSPSTTPEAISATDFPDAGNYEWERFASGFTRPLWLTPLPGSVTDLVLVEQGGKVYTLNASASPTLFMDLSTRISTGGSEQGLLGLAFHPQYESTQWFFVNYTDLNGDTVISRFTAGEGLDSEIILLKVDQPYSNHNGGQLIFGPDGYLYIGMGDGGSADDPLRNGQNVNSLHGALLRIAIEPDGSYTIPEDNPFNSEDGLPEIWAIGLRNPWRFSFDSLTGDLYIGDVGQRSWEEVNFLPAGTGAGSNFGWSIYEGSHPFIDQQAGSDVLTMPVMEYGHDQGCSITGGYVYRGEMPEWQGIYLYGDFCSGTVWGLLRNTEDDWVSKQLFQTQTRISSFGVDNNGEIYLLDYQGGELFVLRKK